MHGDGLVHHVDDRWQMADDHGVLGRAMSAMSCITPIHRGWVISRRGGAGHTVQVQVHGVHGVPDLQVCWREVWDPALPRRLPHILLDEVVQLILRHGGPLPSCRERTNNLAPKQGKQSLTPRPF